MVVGEATASRILTGDNPFNVRPEDYFLQPVAHDIPHWSETMYFHVWNPVQDVGVFVHVGRWPADLDLWWAQVIAMLPDGELLVDRSWAGPRPPWARDRKPPSRVHRAPQDVARELRRRRRTDNPRANVGRPRWGRPRSRVQVLRRPALRSSCLGYARRVRVRQLELGSISPYPRVPQHGRTLQ